MINHDKVFRITSRHWQVGRYLPDVENQPDLIRFDMDGQSITVPRHELTDMLGTLDRETADDAPKLMQEWVDGATVSDGDKVIRGPLS
jgi:hypothetical protein